ncbi:Metalloenzyme, LuxS/M16 peptidase-like protein [Kalaharituber pfeilii]|nr:Metalloenzyme, LuxS/M16 peptidase-like protein [Kalaharituber pfeilii]
MSDLERQPPAQPAIPLILASELQKPQLDDRSYRVIQLPNKLEALLVSDKDTDKASASLSVHVGSFSDSEDLPGQAHAVEHLLFLGTKKYPEENEYGQFLAAHAGYSNAYTARMETNYYFEVGHEHLYGALDRFAQFFIAPLFLEDCLDRELRAVDSEFKKNLQQDTHRLYQLARSLSNPNFPYCHFSTGSLETLRDEPAKRGINVREEFINFHKKYYSANGMKLVVLGREDLDTLQNWVMEMFSGVKNKDLPRPTWEGKPLTEKELLTQCFAKPVTDEKSLEITFPFWDEDHLYKSQPSRYFSHLIGHEGPGSILAYLKEKGWVIGLRAGVDILCSGAGLFQIGMTLTNQGLEHYEEIVKVTFQYINLIKNTPVQEWVFKELQMMSEVDFRFRQKSHASKFTSKLSPVMHKPLPKEWLLSGYLLREYDPINITKAMEFLSPEAFQLMVVSQTPVKGKVPNVKEKWYGTEYFNEKIPEPFLNELRKTVGPNAPIPEGLHLPHKNEFIPTNLEVAKREVKEPTKAPTLIKNTEKMRVWYKKDDTFWVPKAVLTIQMKNPLVYANPANIVRAKFWCELVQDALNEYAYDAQIAGLDYDLSAGKTGFTLQIAGYNDKMSHLLEKVLTKIRYLEVKADRFVVVKDYMTKSYKNWDLAPPYSQIREWSKYLNVERHWLTEEMLDEIESLTMEDVASFVPHLFKQMHIEVLAHGNLYKDEALRLSHQVEEVFRPKALQYSQFSSKRSFIIPPGSKWFYPRLLKDPQNVNSCIEYHLFVGETVDRKLRACLNLFSQVTDEPAFNRLRTQEQLGYIVWSGPFLSHTTMTYRILIQSERSAAYLESRIEKFLEDFKETLTNMSAEEFKKHVNSLINKRLEKVKNLDQESMRFWNHIMDDFYDFTQRDEEVAILRTINKVDLLEFYQTYIHSSSPQRAKLSIHLIAERSTAKNASANLLTPEQQKQTLVQNLAQFLIDAGIKAEPEVLSRAFKDVDVNSQEKIVDTVKRYLEEDWALEGEKLEVVVGKGKELVKQLHPQLVGGGEVKEGAEESLRDSVVIEDVVAWKAGLELTRAAKPVKPLEEFEETGPKL